MARDCVWMDGNSAEVTCETKRGDTSRDIPGFNAEYRMFSGIWQRIAFAW
jgi:hypothetical protein